MSDSPKGDPEGRRLARWRALELSEAGQVARALKALLERAEFNTELCTQLLKDITAEEQTQLMRGRGRIEPRKRFKRKHSGHPLLDNRLRSMLYADESGKSIPHRNASTQPPFFALGTIAMNEEDVDSYCVAADEIKMNFFGRTDLVFHEPHMRNREEPHFYFGGDVKKQLEFDEAIDRLVKETNFVAFGVGIRKDAFRKEFVETGIDPYLPMDVYPLAILLLLERYVDFLAHGPDLRTGRVTFESQGPKEDAYHEREYADMLLQGSQFVPDAAFRNWLETAALFAPKAGSHPLELADMMSRDLFEWIRGDCAVTPKRWELFSDKIYCRGDGYGGKFGVKVFPASDDILGCVVDHRVRCGAVGAHRK